MDIRLADEDTVAEDSAYRFGPTRFSVIPRAAVGNVSIRFVPDQSADHLISCFKWGRLSRISVVCFTLCWNFILSLISIDLNSSFRLARGRAVATPA